MQATLDYRKLIVRKLALRENSCNFHGALLIRLAEGVCVERIWRKVDPAVPIM